MRKSILLIVLALFLFSSCGVTNKKCDGGKKIKTEMW